MRLSRLILLALSLLVSSGWTAAISTYPAAVQLTGRNSTQVIAVSAGESDVTAECALGISNAAVAKISDGVITAIGDGKTNLTVRCKGERVAVPVTVRAAREEPKLSFVKDVVPIFTMAGCAGSNCHGSIRGQNGFYLSLFGYEPDLDFQAIQPLMNR